MLSVSDGRTDRHSELLKQLRCLISDVCYLFLYSELKLKLNMSILMYIIQTKSQEMPAQITLLKKYPFTLKQG